MLIPLQAITSNYYFIGAENFAAPFEPPGINIGTNSGTTRGTKRSGTWDMLGQVA